MRASTGAAISRAVGGVGVVTSRAVPGAFGQAMVQKSNDTIARSVSRHVTRRCAAMHNLQDLQHPPTGPRAVKQCLPCVCSAAPARTEPTFPGSRPAPHMLHHLAWRTGACPRRLPLQPVVEGAIGGSCGSAPSSSVALRGGP